MLEAVVQEKEVRFELLPGGQPRGITAGPGVDRHPGQGPGQPVRLFAHLRGFFISMLPVGDAGDAAALPAVAPAEDGHPLAPVLEQPGQAGHHRGLAGAAHRQVADAHHRGRQFFRPEPTPGVEACAATRPPGHRAGRRPRRRRGPRGREAGRRPGPPEAAGTGYASKAA